MKLSVALKTTLFLLAAVFAALGCGAFLFGLFPTENDGLNALLLISVGSIGWVYNETRRRKGQRSPLYFLAPEVFFPLSLTLYYGIGSIPIMEYEVSVRPGVWRYAMLAAFAFYGGVFVPRLFYLRRPLSPGAYAFTDTPLLRRLTRAYLLILLVLCLFGLGSIVANFGLLLFNPEMLQARTEIVAAIGGATFYFALLYTDVVVIAGVYRIVFGRWIFDRLLVLGGILVLAFLVAQLGSRGRIAVPFIVLFAFWVAFETFYHNRSVRLKTLVGWVGVVYLFLVTAGAYRYALYEGVAYSEAFLRMMFGELSLAATTFDRVLFWFPERADYYGWRYVIAPFMTLLPGEQLPIGRELKELFGLEYAGGGFTPSMLGSLYIIGGPSVIAVGMFIWGGILEASYRASLPSGNISMSLGFLILYAFLVVISINLLKAGFFTNLEPIWHMVVLTGFVVLARTAIWSRVIRLSGGCV